MSLKKLSKAHVEALQAGRKKAAANRKALAEVSCMKGASPGNLDSAIARQRAILDKMVAIQ